MKNLLVVLFVLCCTKLNALNITPLTMEDKKVDAYLMARKPAKLLIQIKNLKDESKKIDIGYTLVKLGTGFQSKKYTETDVNGVAEITLQDNLPYQQIWLQVGNYLYAGIYVNEGLTVTVDVQKLQGKEAYMIGDGIEYVGIDGELNTAMNEKVVFKQTERNNLFEQLSKLREVRKSYSEKTFSGKLDSIRAELAKMDNEFTKDHPNYRWAVQNETSSEFYGTVCLFYSLEAMPDQLFKEVSNHKPYFTSNEGSLYYRYLHSYTLSLPTKSGNNGIKGYLKQFDSLYTSEKSNILKLFLLPIFNEDFAKNYPSIINSIGTKWCKRIASNELVVATNTQIRIDSIFALGKKMKVSNIGTSLMKLPFGAELYQLDSVKSIEAFLISLKSKFANKALILDFWATWCAPCLSDLPFSKGLHEKNKDLAIEYIYVCTSSGSALSIWKKKVAELEIPGIHIYVEDKIVSQLKRALNAEGGFPTYVVIEANGKTSSKAISRMEMLDREGLKKVVGL